MNNPHSSRAASGGFSLIEVTLAMAIASVAIITLVGVIPQGLATMREAGDQAIEARIHQQIMGELQMASFDRLGEFDRLVIYYDAQGEELGDSSSGGGAPDPLEHIYSARVVVPGGSGGGGGNLPQSVGGGSFSGISLDGGSSPVETMRVTFVEIADVSSAGTAFNWDDAANRRRISVFQTYVTDMGQSLD